MLLDSGFLTEPSDVWLKAISKVRLFSEIDHYQFLGCLGEPGIGKTREFIRLKKLKESESDCAVLYIDLDECRTDDFVRTKVVASEIFQSWTAGSQKLYLFFDNLDRLMMPSHQFAKELENAFCDLPLERLYIRIACRTFEWSHVLETRMRAIFNSSEVFELAPLTRKHVALAASCESIDGVQFISDLIDNDAVAFAIKPVSLRFLFNKYKKDKKLPSSTLQLYKDGCLLLSAEPNLELHEQRLQKLSHKQRFAVASRIAAITLFCQKCAVYDGIDDGNVEEENIKIDDLVGGVESFDDVEVEVSKDAIIETLGSALFTSRGTQRFSFAHQTYAEFLAACFLTERKAERDQILSILVHPTEPEHHVVPQLTGVAAWLASMNPDILKFMIENDPTALILADLDKAGGEDKQNIVTKLLGLIASSGLPLSMMAQKYAKLNHPNLGDQLAPLLDKDASPKMVRHEAMRIAEACQLGDLSPQLCRVSLDISDNCEVRAAAITALASIDEESSLRQLIPLLRGAQSEDPEDEVKGALLNALYPKYISTNDLFSYITEPKNESLFGRYALFLGYQLFDGLRPADIPVALSWVSEQQAEYERVYDLPHRIETLRNDIMLYAWDFLIDEKTLGAFAKIALVSLLRHEPVVGGIHGNEFDKKLKNGNDMRRLLIKKLIELASSNDSPPHQIDFRLASICEPSDLEWLLSLLDEFDDLKMREIVVGMAREIYRLDNIQQLEALWTKREIPEVFKCFSWLFTPADLESEMASQMRDQYLRQMQWQESNVKAGKKIEPPPAERIQILLTKSENDQPQAWAFLIGQLTLSESSDRDDEIDSNVVDVRTLPGWKNSNLETRRRILKAALRFLTSDIIEPKIEECLAGTGLTNFLIAGYQALFLLKYEDSVSYSQLTIPDWKRWLGAPLLFPNQDSDERHLQAEIANDAFQAIPDVFIKTVIDRLKFEADEWNWLPTARILNYISDRRLSDAILIEIENHSLKLSSIAALFDILSKSDRASEWAWNQVNSLEARKSNDQVLIMMTARFLDIWIPDRWNDFWEVVQTDSEFGKRVFAEIANWDYPKEFLDKLPEDQLVTLYSWLWKQFPDEGAVRSSMVVEMTPQMMLWDFRGDIPNLLAKRNSESACAALEAILREFPHLVGIRRMLDSSRERLRIKTWLPVELKNLMQLLNSKHSRLVSNEFELLKVVTAAIDDIQIDLQQHQPQTQFLWLEVPRSWINKVIGKQTKKELPDKIYRPVDEAKFCDYIAMQLNHKLVSRGIIINREVMIRVNPGAKGERTDIHVDAIAQSGCKAIFERVTVVIEAKGNWNRALETAMESQLAKQYLFEARSKTGIYLVGYFNCSQWNQDDNPRWKDAQKYTLVELRDKLSKQARELSANGYSIKSIVLDASLRQ
ncbi:MAG: HEAT repeat domain-containing protein [Candidatus Obscuribacter phosphatis]|uniref:HEAT repeat domain-containing protein n=1 Tax=Candidatus Obscuribacter phosphatis TaxID=1906157 RepID=A0A8J7P9K7_9BACT|nr:HEAT repeat domain-containing protein [Candidatus Obscuribacter phosphatis]